VTRRRGAAVRPAGTGHRDVTTPAKLTADPDGPGQRPDLVHKLEETRLLRGIWVTREVDEPSHLPINSTRSRFAALVKTRRPPDGAAMAADPEGTRFRGTSAPSLRATAKPTNTSRSAAVCCRCCWAPESFDGSAGLGRHSLGTKGRCARGAGCPLSRRRGLIAQRLGAYEILGKRDRHGCSRPIRPGVRRPATKARYTSRTDHQTRDWAASASAGLNRSAR
jgi:hypothetical protein